jgi:integrase
MRSGELCQIRPCDLDTGGETWVFRPAHHKTAHLGQPRMVRIGPRARHYLEPLLPPDLTAYVFSPRRARAERYAAKRARRKSKVQPSQICRAKKRPKRAPGARYTTGSYYSAVLYGIEQARKAGALAEDTRWHPHQLRHNHATAVRRQFGLDAARAVLGQRSLAIADTYAEIDAALAAKVAREIG